MKRQSPLERLKRLNFFALPAILFVTIITMFPLIFNIYVSTTGWNLLYGTKTLHFIGIANYISAIESVAFRDDIALSVEYAVFITVIEIALGIGIALMLNRENPLAAAVRVILILPLMMTPFLVYLQWTYLTTPGIGPLSYLMGLITNNYSFPFFDKVPDVYFSFLMVDIWMWLPFVVVILLAGMRSMAKGPFEAAMIDGAGAWAKFRYVMLPALRPVLAIVVLFRFMDSLNSFGNVQAFTGGGPGISTYFISWLIYKTGLGTGSAVGLAAAYAILYMLLVLAIAWSIMYVIARERG